jgi:hypothetical protein
MGRFFGGFSNGVGGALFLGCLIAAAATVWLLLQVLPDGIVAKLTRSRRMLMAAFFPVYFIYVGTVRVWTMGGRNQMLVGAGFLLLAVAGLLVFAAFNGDEEEFDGPAIEEEDEEDDPVHEW